MVNFYQPQINPLYCSAASSVIILNALNIGEIPNQEVGAITKPNGEKIWHKLFRQEGFFNSATNKIKAREIIDYKSKNSNSKYDPGLSLDDLSKILSQVYNLKVQTIHVEKNDAEFANKFRKTLKETFVNKDKFLIANFDGKVLGQKTRGHISPLVAYDEKSDSVLVLDVALHKNKWFWTSVSEIISAMNTKDNDNYRGYLLVERY